MESLDNAFDPTGMAGWQARAERLAEGDPGPYLCELKIDGLAIALVYETAGWSAARPGVTAGRATT